MILPPSLDSHIVIECRCGAVYTRRAWERLKFYTAVWAPRKLKVVERRCCAKCGVVLKIEKEPT